jgi:PAS domain-containing protein
MREHEIALMVRLILTDHAVGEPLIGPLMVSVGDQRLARLHSCADALAGRVGDRADRLNAGVARRDSGLYVRTPVQSAADVFLIVEDDRAVRYASPSAETLYGTNPWSALASCGPPRRGRVRTDPHRRAPHRHPPDDPPAGGRHRPHRARGRAILVRAGRSPSDVEDAAQRVVAKLAEPVALDGSLLNASASITVASTADAPGQGELPRHAGLALYVAKGKGAGDGSSRCRTRTWLANTLGPTWWPKASSGGDDRDMLAEMGGLCMRGQPVRR